MPLEASEARYLRSAHGYLALGMFEEANAELEEIDALCRAAPEVLATRVAIYSGLEKWDLMAVVAGKLVEWNPDAPGYWIDFAYATRRSESIEAAHTILERAVSLHLDQGEIRSTLPATKHR